MINKDRRVALLASVPLFKRCTKKELAKIASLSTTASVEEGRVLCRQGSPGHEAFVIVAGDASVTIDGREIAVLGAGDFFGEMALLDGSARVATVTATTPMDLLVLSTSEFRQMLESNPGVAVRILAGIAARLRDADRAMATVPVGV